MLSSFLCNLRSFREILLPGMTMRIFSRIALMALSKQDQTMGWYQTFKTVSFFSVNV